MYKELLATARQLNGWYVMPMKCAAASKGQYQESECELLIEFPSTSKLLNEFSEAPIQSQTDRWYHKC